MLNLVPFSEVVELLEKHGYRLLRRRKFPGEDKAGLAVFGREGSPYIAIEVRDKKVHYEYFKELLETFEGGRSANDEGENQNDDDQGLLGDEW